MISVPPISWQWPLVIWSVSFQRCCHYSWITKEKRMKMTWNWRNWFQCNLIMKLIWKLGFRNFSRRYDANYTFFILYGPYMFTELYYKVSFRSQTICPHELQDNQFIFPLLQKTTFLIDYQENTIFTLWKIALLHLSGKEENLKVLRTVILTTLCITIRG